MDFFVCCYAELLHFLERYCNLIFFSTPKKMCNATKKLKNSCFAYTQIWIQLDTITLPCKAVFKESYGIEAEV